MDEIAAKWEGLGEPIVTLPENIVALEKDEHGNLIVMSENRTLKITEEDMKKRATGESRSPKQGEAIG
jgi:hypothetical protein